MNNDLISLSAVKRFIQENGVLYSNKLDKFLVEDAERVIRCRDCQSACTVEDDNIICLSWGSYADPDGWCYKGEHRHDEE